jgi:glutathione peroxidase-family protein
LLPPPTPQELPEAQAAEFCVKKGLPNNAPGSRMFAKCHVNGAQAHPVWALAKSKFPGDVQWNFDGIVLFNKEGVPACRTSIRQPPTKEQINAML